MFDLAQYIHKFTILRRDPAKGWPASTRGKSPYKPLLLLAALDQFDQGQLTHNLIELTADLGNLFELYCATVLLPGMVCNIAMPFFHMQGEGFWQLVPLPGKEANVASGWRLITESQLLNNVAGARLDDELFTLLAVKENRDVLRAALIDAHFDEATQPLLWERVATNQAAFLYSSELLEQARKKLKELRPSLEDDGFAREVRDQGFRRAVVVAYNHRCACCGLRIVTPGGHTAVEAAHIIPWSESRNDQPTNGMALCRLCHWSFDEGLMSVATDYRVILSPQLAAHGNMPGLLSMLDARPIFLPLETTLHPDPANLDWRNKKIFRKV
ncbi:MAG TPA: HNH endonuclease [Caldilinea sp.]|nr:HNH endonuclease [Caldilinea sp.]